MTNFWKVTAGRGNAYVQEFLSKNLVAIGWREAGDVTGVRSKAEMVKRFRNVYPDKTAQQADVAASQVWRFQTEIWEEDEVVTYDPKNRLYHLG